MGNNCCKIFKKSKYRQNEDESPENLKINQKKASSVTAFSLNSKNNNNNNNKKQSIASSYAKKGSINSFINNKSAGAASSVAYTTGDDASSYNNSTRNNNKKTSLNDSKHLLIDSGHTLYNTNCNVATTPGRSTTHSYENNKLEESNVPHIADFYPDDNSTVPADNPRISTLFLPKASKNLFKMI
jgi:hypothetical protein